MKNIATAALTFLVLAGYSLVPPRAASRPILIHNEDNTHFFNRGAEHMTREGLRAYVDEATGDAVTHFFMSPNNQRASFESTTFEPMRLALCEPGVTQLPRYANMQLLHERGLDAYAIWIERCRERGVSPWFSMRMNDVHFVYIPSFGGLSKFWRTHPELWRVPDATNGPWTDRAFDYSKPEVRAYHLAFVRELMERYDVDGIECDWIRFHRHLTPGKEKDQAGCLSSFMLDVRRLADDAARRLGHAVRVGARVPSRINAATGLGMDVSTWARDGSIDLLVPCNLFELPDFDLPLDAWRRVVAKAPRHVIVVPGVDRMVRQARNKRGMTLEEYYGWADTMNSRSAPGHYLFNFFDVPPLMSAIRRDGLAPRVVGTATRHYPAVGIECVADGMSHQHWFPAWMDDVRRVEIPVGTCMPGGSVAVLLGFSHPVSAGQLPVRLNGISALSSMEVKSAPFLGKESKCRFVVRAGFSSNAIREGINVFEIGPANDGAVALLALELELSSENMREEEISR